MPFVVQSEIEEGLELAEVPNGLEVPVYNSAEVVPVASELYPVASLDTKIDIITSSSTSHINLETESQKPSSALRDSPLIARKRRKRRLWIFIGAVLLSVICITIGVLVARAVPGKSGNDTSDRSAPFTKIYETSDRQTASTSSITNYPQSTTTVVSLSISVATSQASPTPPAPTALQTSATPSSDPITNVSSNAFTSSTSTSSCPNQPMKCSDSVCEGINNQLHFSQGVCTAGIYGKDNCPCISICGDVPGPCSLNNCSAVNNTCSSGVYRGCNCS